MDPKSDKFRQSELPNLEDFKDEFDQYETPANRRKHRMYVVTCTNCERKILCGSCICWAGCLGKVLWRLKTAWVPKPPEAAMAATSSSSGSGGGVLDSTTATLPVTGRRKRDANSILVVPNTRLSNDPEFRRRMFHQLCSEPGGWQEWCTSVLKPLRKHMKR